MKLSIQSLQLRKINKSGRKTLRMVWDIVSRNDSPARLLIESWGGKPDGYIKCFPTDLVLGKYLSARIAKTAKGATDEELDLVMVGDEEYKVEGCATNLSRTMSAENHENAKLRIKINGSKTDWDEDACLNKTISGLVDFDDSEMSANKLVEALASRVKSTFKRGGTYHEQVLAIHEFMKDVGESFDDVIGTGEVIEYPPMDRERIAGVIQLADNLRTKIDITAPVDKAVETSHEPIPPEPEVIRGEAWGGWA